MVLADNCEMFLTFNDADLTSGNPDDVTGNGNDGTSVGSPTTGATGIVEEAFTYNGSSQYVSYPIFQTSALSTLSAIVWFKTTGTSTQTIMGGYEGSASGYDRIYIDLNSSGNVRFDIRTSVSARCEAQTTGTYNDGDWHMAAFTWDGTDIIFYIDGSSFDTCSLSGTLDMNNYPNIFIGANNDHGTTSSYFTGTIDAVGLWSVELSSTDISDLWNSGNGLEYPFSAGPVSNKFPMMMAGTNF